MVCIPADRHGLPNLISTKITACCIISSEKLALVLTTNVEKNVAFWIVQCFSICVIHIVCAHAHYMGSDKSYRRLSGSNNRTKLANSQGRLPPSNQCCNSVDHSCYLLHQSQALHLQHRGTGSWRLQGARIGSLFWTVANSQKEQYQGLNQKKLIIFENQILNTSPE